MARDLMRAHVVTLGPQESLRDADALLRLGRLRSVPVLEGDRLVGELQLRGVADFAREALREAKGEPPASLGTTPVRRAMAAPRGGVGPDTPLDEVARRLIADRAGYLPVLQGEGTLLGIVTERDLLRSAVVEAPTAPQS